jgi:hypothetical protein
MKETTPRDFSSSTYRIVNPEYPSLMHTNKDRMIMRYNLKKPQKGGIGKIHAYMVLFCKSSVFHISNSKYNQNNFNVCIKIKDGFPPNSTQTCSQCSI